MSAMDIRPIRSEDDYDWALAEVARYFNVQPEPATPEGDRFQVLLDLIAHYEETHWKIDLPADPVAVLQSALEAKGLRQSDLAEILGSKSRASEILSGRRALSKAMVR